VADFAPLAIAAAWVTGQLGEREQARRYLELAEGATYEGPLPLGESSLESAVALLRALQAWEGVSQMRSHAETAYRLEPPGTVAHGMAALALETCGARDHRRGADRSGDRRAHCRFTRVAGRRWPYADRLDRPDHGAHRGLPRDPSCNNETHLRTPARRGARGPRQCPLLVGVAVWVLIKAVDRLRSPVEIDGRLMLIVVVGVLANLVGLLLLHPAQSKSLNTRGAYLEALGDLLGSLAIIVAAVLILITGWTPFDAIASLVIVVVIIPRAWLLLREVVDVLLEATPHGVDLAEVREHIKEVRGEVDVHDLHAWTITSGVPVLSAHVIVDHACISEGRSGEVLDRLGECLGGHFDVSHCIFQLEPVATKNPRPPITRVLAARWPGHHGLMAQPRHGPSIPARSQSSGAEGPAEARGTTMTGSRERRTRRAETPPSSTRRIGP
jgi:cation diffusion facilitator family transporter